MTTIDDQATVVRGLAYVEVGWLCTLPLCGHCGRIVLGVSLPDGTPMRLRLDKDSARAIAETLADFLGEGPRKRGHCPPCGVQSASSSGKPQTVVSSPVGVANV